MEKPELTVKSTEGKGRVKNWHLESMDEAGKRNSGRSWEHLYLKSMGWKTKIRKTGFNGKLICRRKSKKVLKTESRMYH